MAFNAYDNGPGNALVKSLVNGWSSPDTFKSKSGKLYEFLLQSNDIPDIWAVTLIIA